MTRTKRKAELCLDGPSAGSTEKPGAYAKWLKAQEREVEKSAKVIATETAVKKEICQLEEKLTKDRELHRTLAKSEAGLRQLISKEETRLVELKAWKADGGTHPRIREGRYSSAGFEMMALMFSTGNMMLEHDIRREIFGAKAKKRKG